MFYPKKMRIGSRILHLLNIKIQKKGNYVNIRARKTPKENGAGLDRQIEGCEFKILINYFLELRLVKK